MTKALLNRYLRKVHLWFGIGIGLQVGLWLISGLFMTWFPIDHVRGTHLRADLPPPAITNVSNLIPTQAIIDNSEIALSSLTLTFVGDRPVYRAVSDDEKRLLDARTGQVISPLDEHTVRGLAQANYAGEGTIKNARFFETKAPREYGRSGPVWRIDFSQPDAASFYIDANTAELKAVRTGLWRTFDFMWGLHIMDWKSRDNFNSWWIKSVAVLAVIFFLTGLALTILRLSAMLSRRR